MWIEEKSRCIKWCHPNCLRHEVGLRLGAHSLAAESPKSTGHQDELNRCQVERDLTGARDPRRALPAPGTTESHADVVSTNRSKNSPDPEC